ncbi:MAG: hypothetical protein PHQ45_04740 [Acidaminococcaceae bacterium]|jgi:hypothetical protein|nr:hypothetical protein [Acidaminococcaceae bacterium]
MKSIKLLLVISMLFLVVGCGKTAAPQITVSTYPNWVNIKVDQTAVFQVPPSLVKTENLKSGQGNVECQSQDKSKYAHVQFQTIASKEQLPRYGQGLGLKQSEIANFGKITKETIMEQEKFRNAQTSFSEWKDMQSEIINGVECLHISYLRQIEKSPAVRVDRYTFFNKDRIHVLTVSYRQAEKDYWQSKDNKLDDIVTTLKINKRS